MNVIEFPKNRQLEVRNKNKKLDFAIWVLGYLINENADFHIVLENKDASKIFECEKGLKEFTVMTANLEKALDIRINDKISNIYPIEGNELD